MMVFLLERPSWFPLPAKILLQELPPRSARSLSWKRRKDHAVLVVLISPGRWNRRRRFGLRFRRRGVVDQYGDEEKSRRPDKDGAGRASGTSAGGHAAGCERSRKCRIASGADNGRQYRPSACCADACC